MFTRFRKMKFCIFLLISFILLLAFYKSIVKTEDTDVYKKDVKLKHRERLKYHEDDFVDRVFVPDPPAAKLKRAPILEDLQKKKLTKFSFIEESQLDPEDPGDDIRNNMIDHDENNIPNDAREEIKDNEVNEDINNVNSFKDEANNLIEVNKKVRELEEKVKLLELRTPKLFPDVKYLDYKSRKRILMQVYNVSCVLEACRMRPIHKYIRITGGAGFVGSHLLDSLMMQGHEIIVVDNFFTGRKRNVEHWLGHENFELIHHDIVNPLFIEVDEIYHLASPASPPHYMMNPVKTIKTNTLGTINMLGLAKRVGAKVLIASTSEVYGDPTVHPQPETYWGNVNPIGPRACYDEGKRVAETLAYAYAKQERVDVRVARIFNTYGPRMHAGDGRVVSNFIMQALQNLTITIYGNGKQTRSFQYVSDLVDGLVLLMDSNYTQPVNLGNPVEHTIEEFAMIIKDLVEGCKSEVSQVAAVEDDPQRRRPDITRAKTHLGWEPKVDLKDGLRKTIDYFKNELNRSRHSERNIFIPEVLRTAYNV